MPPLNTDVVARFEQGLERCAADYRAAFAAAADEHALRAANARLLGPSGELTQLLKLMPELPNDQRKLLGRRANELKNEIQQAFGERLSALERVAREAELQAPPLDVTLPGRGRQPGRLHPLTRTKHDLLDVFVALGFDIADGPEIDLHEHNFDKLGFPPDHPATDMQDTFFVASPDGGAPNPRAVLLRTHTSTVQIREMLARKPPLAIVSAGATFRRDDDATHSPMFMQLEGFVVDEGISFVHLKGVLTHFLRRVFGQDVPVRFRPSYFPFVEPGGEVDVGCTICRRWQRSDAPASSEPAPALRGGAECRVCKDTGFIEVLGCGMIHPVVFEHVGYDPERYTGFAFGLGIDRVTMLRYGVPHLSLLYGNDPRFLNQF